MKESKIPRKGFFFCIFEKTLAFLQKIRTIPTLSLFIFYAFKQIHPLTPPWTSPFPSVVFPS